MSKQSIKKGALLIEHVGPRLNVANWTTDREMQLTSYKGDYKPFINNPTELINNSRITFELSNQLISGYENALLGKFTCYEVLLNNTAYLLAVSPMMDASKAIIGTESTAIDISSYKKTENDLTALKHHAESILNAAGEGIYGLNLEGKATFVNPAAERMTGWTAEETINQSIHYLHHHSHEDGSPYPHEECPIYAAINDGEIHHVENEVFWRKDGTCFPVEYTSTPIYENGKLAGAVAVFKDITAQKKAKTALLDAFKEVAKLKDQLEEQNNYLQEEIGEEQNFGQIIGTSPCVRLMLQKIEHVAPTNANVLVLGESGTGKELVAHAIHNNSAKRNNAFVKVNCGALSYNLVESELFGHEKGAFTGAHERRKGRFELADGGTLFLDEIGELPLDTQVKLLRVLQEQEFERLGGEKVIRVDVRIIAATNRDLSQQVAEGNFRKDLYYRLNVFPIDVPTLQDRPEDIPLLARHFLSRASRKFSKKLTSFSNESLTLLQKYNWPGNIRELQNVIERASILATTSSIDVTNLLPKLSKTVRATQTLASLNDVERTHILRVLTYTRGVISGTKGAAAILKIHPNTLRSRMIKLDISASDTAVN